MGWELIPAAIGGISSIGSGVKGKQAANEANQRQAQLDQTNQQFMRQGMSMAEAMQNQANSFLQGGGVAGDLMDQARTGGAAFQGQLTDLANQLMGATPTFDFQSGSNLMDQTMQQFQDYATGARNTGFEGISRSFTQGNQALDAMLASSGMSADSGVGAAARGQMAAEGAGQMAGLERDLSAQLGQTALQGAQFDVNRILQEQGMGSQFALGAGAQRGQNLGMAGSLLGQAYQAPLAMQQQMYQQNQLNPFLSMMGMTNPMDFLSMAFGGMNQATQVAGGNAASGGAGMGAGLGNLTGQMFDYLSNKNK